MKRDTKQAASAKSDDGRHSKSAPRATMAIPGPDIGTEYDSKGNPIPLAERLPENREKVEELIAHAAIESEKR
jgi:hypothetical protein